MSIALPILDLTGAGVGNQFTVSFANTGISAGGVSAHPGLLANRPYIKVHNDSGCGLLLIFKDEQDSDHIPPGAWRVYQIMPGESSMILTVEYIIQNPQVSKFTTTYYFPGEYIDMPGILGNSPVGGTVQTSNIQTLSNENNPGGTLFLDAGDTTFAQLITMYNNGALAWYVNQSGVKHLCLTINATGNPLKLGQTNDTVEAVANILLDGTISNSNGVILGTHYLTTPYQFMNNVTVLNGTPQSFTIAGNGGIPSNATFAFVTAFYNSGTSGITSGSLQFSPQGNANNGFPYIGSCQVNNMLTEGAALVPLNTTNGQLTVTAVNFNANSTNAWVYAYIA